MKHFINVTLLLVLFPQLVMANSALSPIAEVVKLRGDISQLSPGASIARKVVLGDKLLEDTSIVTGPKSFIKIKFIDESELNVGPESKIVITEMKKDSVGIISLLKGRIRTEVKKNTKDLTTLKFFVKTRTAAMGVRGTEFQAIFNPSNHVTSLLTYKGEVAMAKIDDATYATLENAPEKEIVRNELTKNPEVVDVPSQQLSETDQLNTILQSKSAVIVPSGQNSFSAASLKKASLPVKISEVQLEALYKNKELLEKAPSNLNFQSAADSLKAKPLLKVANQVAPLEGMNNPETGEFAPKSGGFLDVTTGLYVAPLASLQKVGDIDADTGQYVAPKGLILDANKGFVLDEAGDKLTTQDPGLLVLREDLNKNILKDSGVIGQPEDEKLAFNLNEKFIRERILFSFWGMGQTLTSNEANSSDPFLKLTSSTAYRFSFEWLLASNNRFSPTVGLDYSIVNYADKETSGASLDSRNLIAPSLGLRFALTRALNLYAKFGLHQDHYLDQTTLGTTNTYHLQKVVVARLGTGVNAEFWRKSLFSMDLNGGIFFTFRKRINNLVVGQGTGVQFEVLPKYALSEFKWIGLGFKSENQTQKCTGTVGVNNAKRASSGLELKYQSDF
jgi:hypothetical protein